MKANLSSDIKAGIVVFLVALPLCLGIAMACGAPLFSGVIAGVAGGIFVTSVSNARYSVSGPAAGLTVIVISALAELGDLNIFCAAVFMAGIVQLVLGSAKAGFIGEFIPNAVVKGMLAGIGIILIIKQLPHIVGYDSDPEGDLYYNQTDGQTTLSALQTMMKNITPGAVVITVVSFIIMIVAERPFYKKNKVLSLVPGPLVVVLVAMILCTIFQNNTFLNIASEHRVDLPSIRSSADLMSNLHFPDFSMWQSSKFWFVVFTIAIIASLESLLSIEAIEKLDPEKIPVNSNRELIAQGVGNMVSGALGGLPVTSVIVRSSANINSGAKTKLSVYLHATLLLGCVLLIPGVLGLIPNAALAVVLIFTGYKLANIVLIKKMFHAGLDQFLPFAVTIAVMLYTDMLKGVGAGILVAVFFIIRTNIRSTFETLEQRIDGKRIYLLRMPQHATFFNKGFMTKYLTSIEDDSKVIIDGTINKSTDKDVREVLQDFRSSCERRNIEIQLVKYNL